MVYATKRVVFAVAEWTAWASAIVPMETDSPGVCLPVILDVSMGLIPL
jgi:hypothetical protein